MAGAELDVAIRLAREAAELRADLLAAPPIDGLASFGRAATVSQWAAMAGRDARELDAIVELGVRMIGIVAQSPGFLDSDVTDLCELLTFTGWCYLDRFEYRLDVLDLDEADRYAGQAIALANGSALPVPTWIRAQTVRARVADWRFELTGDSARLEGAIRLLEGTLERDSDPISMAALARALRHRAAFAAPDVARVDLSNAADLLETLIDPGTQPPPIPVYPILLAQWMAELGLVHLAAYQSSGQARYLDRARTLVRGSLETWPLSAEAALALADVEETGAAYRRVWHLATANAWAFLQASCRLAKLSERVATNVVAVGGAARSALDLLYQVVERQVNDTNKAIWLPLVTEMTALAAPALGATGDTGLAAAYVERGRTRILQDRFPDEEHELIELAAAGGAELIGPIRRVLDILRDVNASGQMRAQAQVELNRFVGKIRTLPGLELFRSTPSAEQLGQIAQAPLIYLVPGDPAGVALVIHPSGKAPLAVPLPGCPRVPIPEPVRRFRAAAFAEDLPPGARRWALEEVATWAGSSLAEPLGDVLAEYPSAYVIAASWLAVVPFHAARSRSGERWRYLIEDIDLRYVPSARALAAALKREVPELESKLLVVPQPSGGGPILQGALAEVCDVAARFTNPVVLDAERIDVDEIRRAIGGVGWLHASCHAMADPVDPLASGLLLADGGRFTLRDLFRAKERQLLVAVLSACQTNVPDARFPDEAMSLAAGLLLGGCRAVIASAWQVPDATTAALMGLFYRRWRIEGDDVPTALRHTQVAFATGTAKVDGWSDDWSQPYFWAGFSYIGP
jgi:hypothetical protein